MLACMHASCGVAGVTQLAAAMAALASRRSCRQTAAAAAVKLCVCQHEQKIPVR